MLVSLQTFYDAVNPVAVIVLTGVAAYAVKRADTYLKAHFGANTAKTLGDVLDKVIAEGIIVAQQKLTEEEKKLPTVAVNNIVAGYAVQYALDHPSGIANQLTGKDLTQLADVALARLNK